MIRLWVTSDQIEAALRGRSAIHVTEVGFWPLDCDGPVTTPWPDKVRPTHAQTFVLSADLYGTEDRTGDCEGYFPRGAIAGDQRTRGGVRVPYTMADNDTL